MKLSKNQRGFSVIEMILLIVVVGLLGATSWLVYDRQKNKGSSQTKSEITSFEECVAAGNPVMESYPEQCAANGKTFTKKVEETAKPAYEGERYTSSKGGFSMVLLNGWQIETDTTYDYLFQYDVSKISYNPQAKLRVTATDASGVGGYVPGIKISINEFNEEVIGGNVFRLNDGTTGHCKTEKYTPQDINNSPAGGAIENGNFISQNCFFTKNGKKLRANYAYYEKEALNVAAVEWAFKTIEIK